MAIDLAVVRRVAALAHLRLSPEEEASLTHDLARILDYVEMLRAVPTEGVPITTHPVALPDALRPDEPQPGVTHDDALRGAADADRARGLFRVPRVV